MKCLRNIYWWLLTGIAVCLAIPALLLGFAAEKLQDYIDEHEQH